MSKCIKSQLPLLKSLCKCSPKDRHSLLRHADNHLVKSICECCVNTLSGRVKLNALQKKKLRRYKKTLRLLSQRKISLKSKKKQIVQTGGSFLLALLPAAISTILSLLKK